ncbi:MAG TPA: hypothetical protein VGR87_10370 [Candidatus Limnocylindria bacterium]|jgi:hypothetical protein|nr:hypothetical protein [Candidatus Limnocylindria bacterium]
MRRWAPAVAVALLACAASSVFARETAYEEEGGGGPAAEPRRADPVPFVAPPPGIYYVTETYVADVVTTSGLLTTYGTTTIHESTGSYARVLDTVGTGDASIFDGSAFNGRRTLNDGRSVAGAYYENFVLTDAGFIAVSVVFFQDDAELSRLSTLPPARTLAPATPRPAAPTPAPPCCAAVRPTPVPQMTARRPIRPGLSLRPTSLPLSRIEVLRGRPVELWLRAFVDDREIPVSSWAVTYGEPGDAVATTGGGAIPFRTSWKRLAPPGAAYDLVFRVEVDTPETGRRTIDAPISIIVRAPALQS